MSYSAIIHRQQQPSLGYYFSPSPKFPSKLSRAYQEVAKPITPTGNDVLFGRGGKNNLHCGNEQLRKLARAKANEYQQADKKEKSNVSMELVSQVHALSPAGRFLRRDPVTMVWSAVAEELAREKCAQCLRDAVTSMKKQQITKPNQSKPVKKKRTLQTTEAPKKNLRRVSDYEVSATTSKKRRRTELKATPTVITGNFFDICPQREPANLFDIEIDSIGCESSVSDDDLLREQFEEICELGVL